MDALDIMRMPTILENNEMVAHMEGGCKGVHESVLRSYHIVAKVRQMLTDGYNIDAVLELMGVMEAASSGGKQ